MSTYKRLSTMRQQARKMRIPIVRAQFGALSLGEREDAFFTTVIPFLTARKQPCFPRDCRFCRWAFRKVFTISREAIVIIVSSERE